MVLSILYIGLSRYFVISSSMVFGAAALGMGAVSFLLIMDIGQGEFA